MSALIVIGAQWGDEGKGKVIDLYTEQADVVVRFGGGANAGHTLVAENKKYVTHLIPSGVLRGAGKTFVMTDGMVIDPQILLEEIELFIKDGYLDPNALLVSPRAHVILPFHKELDALREQGEHAIGTTRRGIGPAYESKMARQGIRLQDLLNEKTLRSRLEMRVSELTPLFTHYGKTLPDLNSTIAQYVEYGRRLKPFLQDTSIFVYQALKMGKRVLFEGAQGTLLDIDHGTYPYVTSSNTLAAAACVSTGIGPTTISGVLGVTKAYATRVGEGPFPSEIFGTEGDFLRETGGEYGATTGRPRRCGWLDLPALKLAVRKNGLTSLAMTKLDILSAYETIKICTSYETEEGVLEEFPDRVIELKPIYKEFKGWKSDLRSVRSWNALPNATKEYIRFIEKEVGIRCSLLSVGADRNEIINVAPAF